MFCAIIVSQDDSGFFCTFRYDTDKKAVGLEIKKYRERLIRAEIVFVTWGESENFSEALASAKEKTEKEREERKIKKIYGLDHI